MQRESRQNRAAPAGARAVRSRSISGDILKSAVLFLVFFLVIKLFVVEGYQVSGPSMSPTLCDGDRVLVFKLPFAMRHAPLLGRFSTVRPGDIVVFQENFGEQANYVKRVIAANPAAGPTDTVSASTHAPATPSWADSVMIMMSEMDIYVDAQKLDQSYLPPWERDDLGRNRVVLLEPGEVYVMGDHRSVSRDSRDFGPIHEAQVIGKAVFRFWPPGRAGRL